MRKRSQALHLLYKDFQSIILNILKEKTTDKELWETRRLCIDKEETIHKVKENFKWN